MRPKTGSNFVSLLNRGPRPTIATPNQSDLTVPVRSSVPPPGTTLKPDQSGKAQAETVHSQPTKRPPVNAITNPSKFRSAAIQLSDALFHRDTDQPFITPDDRANGLGKATPGGLCPDELR